MPSSNLGNKVVVLTGATSGIGAAAALRLARRGASLVIAGRRQDRGDAVVTEALAAGAKAALFVRTDVTSAASVEALFAATQTKLGGVDAVFVNAGAFVIDNYVQQQGEDRGLQTMVDVNIKGTTLVTREAVKALRARGPGGALILTSSIGASIPVGAWDALGAGSGAHTYLATKAYVDALGRTLTAFTDVRSYTVAPSVYATEMVGGEQQAAGFAALAHSALKGIPGKPDELAPIVEALVDGTTAWPSGSLIATEGPYTYDGSIRYAQIYDPNLRGHSAPTVAPEQLRDARGRPAQVTQGALDKLVAAAAAAAGASGTTAAAAAAQ